MLNRKLLILLILPYFLFIILFFNPEILNKKTTEEIKSTHKNNAKNQEIKSYKKYKMSFAGKKLLPLEYGIYHGAFPDFGPTEDKVTKEKTDSFKNIIEKDIVWGYFSNNWFNGIKFPEEQIKILYDQKIIPFIRLMPRSEFKDKKIDKIYTLQKIINGEFDKEIKEWAQKTRLLEIPILIDFAPEPNGNWFNWSGILNGGSSTNQYGDPNYPDGPEKFKDAYRHIIDIFRKENALNVTWFFHINIKSEPDEWWNNPIFYYPGDEYIDWIGISVYGAQHLKDKWILFSELMEDHFDNIKNISNEKPIAILEFGVIEQNGENKSYWIEDALNTIINNKEIKAISYWHSNWINKDGTQSKMRIDSSLNSLESYKKIIKNKIFVTVPNFSD